MVCFPTEAVDKLRNRLATVPQSDGPPVVQRQSFLVSAIQSSDDPAFLTRLQQLVSKSGDEIIVHHLREPGNEAQTRALRQWTALHRKRNPGLHLIETGVDLANLSSPEAILLAKCMDTALVVRSFRVQRPEPVDRIFLDPFAARLDEPAAERLRSLFAAVVHPFPSPRLVLLPDQVASVDG